MNGCGALGNASDSKFKYRVTFFNSGQWNLINNFIMEQMHTPMSISIFVIDIFLYVFLILKLIYFKIMSANIDFSESIYVDKKY